MRGDEYDWLELHPRPKKDGLHDSGYRYIRLVGVKMSEKRDGHVTKEDLEQWSDHVVLEAPVNIDVEPDGTIRLAPWAGGRWVDQGHRLSSAIYQSSDPEQAASFIRIRSSITP